MKKNLSLPLCLLLTLSFAVAAYAQEQANSATPDKAATSKVVQLLEGTGNGYTKAGEGVWVMKYKGKNLPEFNVITVYAEGMLILAVNIVEKANFKLTPDLMQKLLNFNDSMDRVKVGLDNKDGDLFVRIDLTLRIVDQKEFNENLSQISAATDEIYVALKPFLLAPKK